MDLKTLSQSWLYTSNCSLIIAVYWHTMIHSSWHLFPLMKEILITNKVEVSVCTYYWSTNVSLNSFNFFLTKLFEEKLRGVKMKKTWINQKACCFYCTNNKSDLGTHHTFRKDIVTSMHFKWVNTSAKNGNNSDRQYMQLITRY